MEEIWIDVKDYEEYLMVSNLGRIYRKPRIIKTSHYTRFQDGVIASLCDDKNGYKIFNTTINMKRKNFKVHRLVAEAFCKGFSEEKNEVNHIDGKKDNNIYTNLEWSSRAENMSHARESGLITFSERTVYHYDCSVCCKKFSSHDSRRVFCSQECSEKNRRKVKERPFKQELLKLLKSNSIVSISKIYGVSDNAVRKWCKSYELPYRKKDIKEMI